MAMIFKNRTTDATDPKEEEKKGKYTYGRDERSNLASCFCPKTTWLESEYAEKEEEKPSKV